MPETQILAINDMKDVQLVASALTLGCVLLHANFTSGIGLAADGKEAPIQFIIPHDVNMMSCAMASFTQTPCPVHEPVEAMERGQISNERLTQIMKVLGGILAFTHAGEGQSSESLTLEEYLKSLNEERNK